MARFGEEEVRPEVDEAKRWFRTKRRMVKRRESEVV